METKRFMKSQLQNMEHYQFATRVLTLCREANQPKLTAVLTPLENAVNAEDKALNQPKAVLQTEALEEADHRRDKSYRALKLAVDLQLHSNDEEMLAAAEAVAHAMSAYPGVTAANYDKETGLIRNLVADLIAAPMAANVTKVGAMPFVDRLEEDNTAFDQLFHERIKGTAPTVAYDIKQLRAATDRALDAVLRRIEALDELEPTPAITTLIAQYNSLIENRRAMLTHRSGVSQSAREKRLAEYAALLQPGFAALKERLSLPAGSLSFTGKTEGPAKKRRYELAVAGYSRTLRVGVNKDGSLYEWVK